MSKLIAVVDDEPDIVELIAHNLKKENFRVKEFYEGPSFLSYLENVLPDLIILDLMLPEIDGLEVCRMLKMNEKTSSIPIIMLTAMTTDDDRLTGLDLGADDYVTKPFSPRELAARVRAVLRRLPGERGPERIIHGTITVDFLKHEAFLENRSLNLTPVEFKLLGAFVKEPGRVFSRAQIIDKALGYDFDGFDRTIDVHILKLRRKLEPDPRHPRYIKTVYGAGYKLLEVDGDT